MHDFYTAGSRNELEGVGTVRRQTLKEAAPKKRYFFVIGKYVRDIKQGQKIALDLLELLMKATDPVREELRGILNERNHF